MYGDDYSNRHAHLSFGLYAVRRYLHGDATRYLSERLYLERYYVFGDDYRNRYAYLPFGIYFV